MLHYEDLFGDEPETIDIWFAGLKRRGIARKAVTRLLLMLAVATALTLLTPPCAADTITFSASTWMAGVPTGNHADFSGGVDIPLFDPALGTLDAITYTFQPSVSAQWAVNSRTIQTSMTDTNLGGSITFIGDVYAIGGTGMVSSTGGSVCHQGACDNIWSESMPGVVRRGSVEDLMDYTGQGFATLPISIALDASIGSTRGEDGHWYFGQSNNALDVAGLAGARAGFYLNLVYGYTPAPPSIEAFSVDVTETPEPRTIVLCSFLLIAFILLKHIPAAPPFV